MILKKRNLEIELLRFIFSSLIVLHHARYLYGDGVYSHFLRGSFSVDFFFILSGYLMMYSIKKRRLNGMGVSLAYETLLFIKKKVSGLYLELVIANILGILFVLMTATASFSDIAKKIILSFPSDFLFLRMWLYCQSFNGPIWYVSTMILCMMILFPLLLKWPEFMSIIIAPIISGLLLGYLWFCFHSVLNPPVWVGVTYKGNIRGMGEICLGVWTFKFTEYIKMFRYSLFARLLATYVKWICYIIVVIWMIFYRNTDYEPILIGMYVIGIALTFSELCLDLDLYNNRICFFLGKLSTPLFLSHFYLSSPRRDLASIMNVLPQSIDIHLALIIYYCTSLFLALTVMIIAEYIRKSNLLGKMRSIMIVE